MSRTAWDHSFDNVMHEPILLWRAGGIRQAELLAADSRAEVKQARGALDQDEVLDGQLRANARELVGLEQLLLRGLLRETIMKGASLIGVDVRQLMEFEPDHAEDLVTELLEWAGEGRLSPPLGQSFPFSQAREALSYALSGKGVGKTVLTLD